MARKGSFGCCLELLEREGSEGGASCAGKSGARGVKKASPANSKASASRSKDVSPSHRNSPLLPARKHNTQTEHNYTGRTHARAPLVRPPTTFESGAARVKQRARGGQNRPQQANHGRARHAAVARRGRGQEWGCAPPMEQRGEECGGERGRGAARGEGILGQALFWPAAAAARRASAARSRGESGVCWREATHSKRRQPLSLWLFRRRQRRSRPGQAGQRGARAV
jgi:hypothetical protein